MKHIAPTLAMVLACAFHAPAQDTNQKTFRDAAAFNNNPAEVIALLEAGAEINARDEIGNTALHSSAILNDNTAVMTALLEAGANPNAHSKAGWTPLHLAAGSDIAKNRPAAVALLLEAGADPNAQNKDDWTPLHSAARNNKNRITAPVIVLQLLDAGANPNAQDNGGNTPWDYAKNNEALKGTDAYWRLKDQEPGSKPDATAGTIEKLAPHFRKAFWGDSANEVQKKETAEYDGFADGIMSFKAEVASVPVFIFYIFEADKLVKAGYIGNQGYSQDVSFLNDFSEFSRLLTAKYGTPEIKTVWSNDYAKKNMSNTARDLARSVSYGYLTVLHSWQTVETHINLELKAKEYKISFIVHYFSKELSYLLDRSNNKKDAAKLDDF